MKAGSDRLVRIIGRCISAAVVCVTLSLGLWPFHAPKNEVSWMRNRDGLRFGRFATAFSSAPFWHQFASNGPQATLEIWLRPRNPWAPSTLLTFYTAGDPNYFAMRQSETDLTINANGSQGSDAGRNMIRAGRVFHRQEFAFLAITSGPRRTCVYADGALVVASPPVSIIPEDPTSRLILGDSPLRTDSWSGELLGLAIYSRELSASQIRGHLDSWQHSGRPVILPAEHNIGLFLFDEHSGNTVHDRSGNRIDLRIPAKYEVVDKAFLEPLWSEFRPSRSYWGAVIKNVVGFVPFGFFFCACLALDDRIRRAVLITIAFGAILSLSIELGQAFLPTRSSGLTDVFTNTLGTALGAGLSLFPRLLISSSRTACVGGLSR